jgi:metallo-beta-lactamase family protein
VPVFAVGRTQLLLYLLAGAFSRKTLPKFPIYLDSPMAIKATRIYGANNELFDEEAKEMVLSGDLRKNLDIAKACPKPAQSRALNDVEGPCMIMAGAGMCTGGTHRPSPASQSTDQRNGSPNRWIPVGKLAWPSAGRW